MDNPSGSTSWYGQAAEFAAGVGTMVFGTALILAPRLIVMWLVIRYLPPIFEFALLGFLGEWIGAARGAWRSGKFWVIFLAVAWCAAGIVGFWWLLLYFEHLATLARRGIG